ncbi:hypothetical protein H261_07943 [Paramagnetospirillum caucaseum]|uniref:Methyltransferase type 11 domain-containing protein n=1 Tax=Paramagnetospirillum caucaseum TaxID=1244869 RepID=M2Z8A9_9PROT|nr:hypothetical protein [Paramagnetospirillum caucaseum]EME70545.1 hypothetical protein H261_07943 [Paramagnetospirillum caucaseum]
MGISPFIAEGLAQLAADGHFKDSRSLLEFGPQTVVAMKDHTYYFDLARRVGGPQAAQDFAGVAHDGKAFRPDAQKALYRLFGIEEYASVDLLDPTATYNHNLNDPLVLDRQFDIVTDFGTGEHVFNIGQNFVNAHNALKVGGLWLAQWPTLGGYHHGFYNIHNIWYRSLAKFSGYELVMLLHSSDVVVTAMACERQKRLVKAQDIRTREPRRMSMSFYLADVLATLSRGERVSAVILAALRKTKDGPLVWPQQVNKYAKPR